MNDNIQIIIDNQVKMQENMIRVCSTMKPLSPMRRINERGREEQLCRVCKNWYLRCGFAAHAAAEKRKHGDFIYAAVKTLESPPIQKQLKTIAKKIIRKNASLTEFK